MGDLEEEYPFWCERCGEPYESQEALDAHLKEMDDLADGTLSVEEYMENDDA